MASKEKKSGSTKEFSEAFRREFGEDVACPWCKSKNNEIANPFGGTVSEITFRCLECKNVFGWMKWEKRLPD